MSPTPQQVRNLFEYMQWGDLLMLRAARTVADAEYYADRGISFGSIHKLLVHAMVAQKTWLARWQGTGSIPLETDLDHPTRDDLDGRWPRVHADLFAFLDGQTTETLGGPSRGTNRLGEPYALPLGGLMMHVADHATYHRGQLNSMIKMAGGTPCQPFYFSYLKQHAGPA